MSPDINLRRSTDVSSVQRPVTVSNNQNDSGEFSARSNSNNAINNNSGKSAVSSSNAHIMHSRSTNDTTTLQDSDNGSGNLHLPIYDLVGVSNHHGSLHGGHYIAHVDTNMASRYGGGDSPETAPRWMCFNDSRVTNANAASIAGPTAYVLFYKIRE